MIAWLRRLLSKRAEQGPVQHEMVVEFEAFLATRLKEMRGPVSEAFAQLFAEPLPDDVDQLAIEIERDVPGFGFVLRSMDANNCETPKVPGVTQFNQRIDALWPIVTDEDMDRFTVWENDPTYGRQHALEQPLDAMDVSRLVKPWFQEIVAQTGGGASRKVTFGVHDLSDGQDL